MILANLTVVNNTQPNGGRGSKVEMKPDGTFTYTPGPNFTGTEKFFYTVSDGIRESTAAVTFTITDGRQYGR